MLKDALGRLGLVRHEGKGEDRNQTCRMTQPLEESHVIDTDQYLGQFFTLSILLLLIIRLSVVSVSAMVHKFKDTKLSSVALKSDKVCKQRHVHVDVDVDGC